MPIRSEAAPSPDEVANMAARGEDVARHFTNEFTVVRPVRRVSQQTDLSTSRRSSSDQEGPKRATTDPECG